MKKVNTNEDNNRNHDFIIGKIDDDLMTVDGMRYTQTNYDNFTEQLLGTEEAKQTINTSLRIVDTSLPTVGEIQNSEEINYLQKRKEIIAIKAEVLDANAMRAFLDGKNDTVFKKEFQKQFDKNFKDGVFKVEKVGYARQLIKEYDLPTINYDIEVLDVNMRMYGMSGASLNTILHKLIETVVEYPRCKQRVFGEATPKEIISDLSIDMKGLTAELEDWLVEAIKNAESDDGEYPDYIDTVQDLISGLNVAMVDKNFILHFDQNLLTQKISKRYAKFMQYSQTALFKRKSHYGKALVNEASTLILRATIEGKDRYVDPLTKITNIKTTKPKCDVFIINSAMKNDPEIQRILDAKLANRISTVESILSDTFRLYDIKSGKIRREKPKGRVDTEALTSIVNNHPMAVFKQKLDAVLDKHMCDTWSLTSLADFNKDYLKAMSTLTSTDIAEFEGFATLIDMLSVSPLIKTEKYGTAVKTFGVQSIFNLHEEEANTFGFDIPLKEDGHHDLTKWTPMHDDNVDIIKNLSTGIANNATIKHGVIDKIDVNTDMISELDEQFRIILASHLENTVSTRTDLGSTDSMIDQLYRHASQDELWDDVQNNRLGITNSHFIRNMAISLDDLSVQAENELEKLFNLTNKEYLSMLIGAGYFDVPISIMARLKAYGIDKEVCYNKDVTEYRFPKTSIEALLPELYDTIHFVYGSLGRYIPATVANMMSANKDDLKAIQKVNELVSVNGGASYQSIADTDKFLETVSAYYKTPSYMLMGFTNNTSVIMHNLSSGINLVTDNITELYKSKEISNAYKQYFTTIIGNGLLARDNHNDGSVFYRGTPVFSDRNEMSVYHRIPTNLKVYTDMVKAYGRKEETPLSMPCYIETLQNTGTMVDASTRFINRLSYDEIDYNKPVQREFMVVNQYEALMDTTYSERRTSRVRYERFNSPLIELEHKLISEDGSHLNLSKLTDFKVDQENGILQPLTRDITLNNIKYEISSERNRSIYNPSVCDGRNYLVLRKEHEKTKIYGIHGGYFECIDGNVNEETAMYIENKLTEEIIGDSSIRNEYAFENTLTLPKETVEPEKDNSQELGESENDMSSINRMFQNNNNNQPVPIEPKIEKVPEVNIVETLTTVNDKICKLEVEMSDMTNLIEKLSGKDDVKSTRRIKQVNGRIKTVTDELKTLINERDELTSTLPEEVAEVVVKSVELETLPTKEEIDEEIGLIENHLLVLQDSYGVAEEEYNNLLSADTSNITGIELEWHQEDIDDSKEKLTKVESSIQRDNDRLIELNKILESIRKQAFANGNIEEIKKFFIPRVEHEEAITILSDEIKSLSAALGYVKNENDTFRDHIISLSERVTVLENAKPALTKPREVVKPKAVELEVLEPSHSNTPELDICNTNEDAELVSDEFVNKTTFTDVGSYADYNGIGELLVMASTGVVVTGDKEFVTNSFRPSELLKNDEVVAMSQLRRLNKDTDINLNRHNSFDGFSILTDIKNYTDIDGLCVVPNVSSLSGIDGINVVYRREDKEIVNKKPSVFIDTKFLTNRDIYTPLIDTYFEYVAERNANQSRALMNKAWVKVVREASALKAILASTRRLKEYDINNDEIYVNGIVVKSLELFNKEVSDKINTERVKDKSIYIITPRSVANYYQWSPMPGNEADSAVNIEQYIDNNAEEPTLVKTYADGTTINIPLSDTKSLLDIHVTRGKESSPLRASAQELKIELNRNKVVNDIKVLDNKSEYENGKHERDMKLLDYSVIIDKLKTELKITATEAELKALAEKQNIRERDLAINSFVSAKSSIGGADFVGAVKSVGSMLGFGGTTYVGSIF